MLGVIAVVEAEQVVQSPVVACCAERVFVVSLQSAQSQPNSVSGQISEQEEARIRERECRPQGENQPYLNQNLNRWTKPPFDAHVVR
jgi:hypothetical protein